MKTTLLALIAGAAALSATHAGTIAGTVRAEGRTDAGQDEGGGKYDSRKFKFAERINYAELRDFVVYLEGATSVTSAPPAAPLSVDTYRVTQRSAEFNPHVLPVVRGTTVEWPNHDEILHNVFSMSDAKPFDLGLYKGNPESKRVTFDKAGRVDVFCSIHSRMHCVVLVLENPCFAVSDRRGHYAITNVPPGTYTVKAWHERLPAQSRKVTVPETGAVQADFVLGITNLPVY